MGHLAFIGLYVEVQSYPTMQNHHQIAFNIKRWIDGFDLSNSIVAIAIVIGNRLNM